MCIYTVPSAGSISFMGIIPTEKGGGIFKNRTLFIEELQ
jgi:hypothetical protein